MSRRKATAEATTEPETIGTAVGEVLSQGGAEPDGQQSREPGDDTVIYPKARSWKHDNVAGVELMSYRDDEKRIYEMWIRFRDGKPSEEIRQIMKDQKFQWHDDAPKGGGNFDVEGAWALKVGYQTASQDRLTAERTYFDVVDAMLKAKGAEAEPSAGRTPF